MVITFPPRSKRLLISWLQSPSAVIWEPKKIKSDTVSSVSPSSTLESLVILTEIHFSIIGLHVVGTPFRAHW